MINHPGLRHLANAELASVPPKRRGALPNVSLTVNMKLLLIKKY
jgi:hypothetical protein